MGDLILDGAGARFETGAVIRGAVDASSREFPDFSGPATVFPFPRGAAPSTTEAFETADDE